jgi:adenylate cyclase
VLNSFGQQTRIDSLLKLKELQKDGSDSIKAALLIDLAKAYQQVNISAGLVYADQAIQLSEGASLISVQSDAVAVKGTLLFIKRQFSEAYNQFEHALRLCERLQDDKGMANALNNLGLVLYSLTDYGRALENFFRSVKLNEGIGNNFGLALNFGNIGNIYNALQEYKRAVEYYERAQLFAAKAGNDQYRDALLNNIGNSYTQLTNYDKALQYKLEALSLSRKSGNKQRMITGLGNVGNVYLKMGAFERALQYHREGLALNSSINDPKLNVAGWFGLGEAFSGMGNVDSSFYYLTKAYHLAVNLKDVQFQANAMEKLSTLYRQKMQMDSAYTTYRRFVELQGTLENSRKLRDITQLTLKYQFAKKEDSLVTVQLKIDNELKEKSLLATRQQQELERRQARLLLAEKQKQIQHLAWLESQSSLRAEQATRKVNEKQIGLLAKEKEVQQAQLKLQTADLQIKEAAIRRQKILTYFYISGIVFLLLTAFFILRNYINQRRSNRIIEAERQKSDGLLLNILPVEVAQELKDSGESNARYYEDVTVIFTDFVGFTKIAESLTPQQLVSELNTCFTAFDQIAGKYGIEKIKTIGDAYMAVAGLPTPREDHADVALLVAREFLTCIEGLKQQAMYPFEVRVGVHSGPVVAGIVGKQKFAYDVWGDTVNIASRMESSGVAGKINISGSTYKRLTSDTSCTYRGKIDAKNKGVMDMYLVD